jgi:indolepyruvate ferredoxin oxidoreductase alpha subunit
MPVPEIRMVYPLPPSLIKNFAQSLKRLIVLEELDPFIEEHVSLIGGNLFKNQNNYPKISQFSHRW